MIKSNRIFLITVLSFCYLFLLIKNADAQTLQAQLDISIINGGLLINSCGQQLPLLTGYKGYINNIEFMSTGDFGGFPCYGGGLFIPNLNNFYSINASTTPFDSRFDFYSNSDFNSPIIKTFTIYYNGQNFSLSSSTLPVCSINCNSSVMFFPGIMGTKLYDSSGELWISRDDSKQLNLALDDTGKSIGGVFTKDDTQNINDEAETGIVDEAFGANIYNTFINNLSDWKNDGTISDYAFVPYDWRLSLEDIITSGATTTGGYLFYNNNQNFDESYVLKKLVEMQKNSKSGKVTLIGHSNGGLVIKALVQKLKDTNNPLYDKIDKIIFVAVPQVGTPDAVASLLHGNSLGPFGVVMSSKTLRTLAEDMPAVYNLLPSSSYFGVVDSNTKNNQVINFDNASLSYNQDINLYGNYVDNSSELQSFILGTDGRTKPSKSDLDNPNIGNIYLYQKVVSTHSVLDNWQPPQNTKVIQVAGWGMSTLSGIEYKTCRDYGVLDTRHNCIGLKHVVDGDGVVVVPSALWLSESNPNVERWWVNLKKLNTLSNLNIFREHRDILEIEKINNFIKSKIMEDTWGDSEGIIVNDVNNLPTVGTYLNYTLHSPLILGVYDNLGRYTGLDPITKEIRQEIPDSKYEIVGDTQFVSIPESVSGQVKLKGITSGVFTVDIEKQVSNNIVESTSIGGVPSFTQTVAYLDVNPNLSSTTLNIDNDGDGLYEKQINTNSKSEVIYDDIAPEIALTYSTTTKSIVFSGNDLNLLNTEVSTSSVRVSDSQGNFTVLYFTGLKNEKGESKIVLKKINRNGKEEIFPNIEVKFEMEMKKSIVTEFKSEVETKEGKLLDLKYQSEKGVTKIKDSLSGTNIVKTGIVIEKVITSGKGVKFEY